MRRIEMKSTDPEKPALVEMVEGRRYLAVLNTPEGAPEMTRIRMAEHVRASLPGVAVFVLPHGYTFDLYEEAESGGTSSSSQGRRITTNDLDAITISGDPSRAIASVGDLLAATAAEGPPI